MNDDETKIDEMRKLIDNEIGYIVLITDAKDDDSNDIWIYASIPPSKYEEFLKAEALGAYNIYDFGSILEMGEGKTPPEEIIKKMEEEYGTNDQFEKIYKETVNTLAKNPLEVIAEKSNKLNK